MFKIAPVLGLQMPGRWERASWCLVLVEKTLLVITGIGGSLLTARVGAKSCSEIRFQCIEQTEAQIF